MTQLKGSGRQPGIGRSAHILRRLSSRGDKGMVGTSRVNREVYARFCGRLEVKSLRPTRQSPNKPRVSSPLTRSSMATFVRVGTDWQPVSTARPGLRHSISGSRTTALGTPHDRREFVALVPRRPPNVNVTMPSPSHFLPSLQDQ